MWFICLLVHSLFCVSLVFPLMPSGSSLIRNSECSPSDVLHVSCGFIVFHFSSLFSRLRLQLHELLLQAFFQPLLILTASSAFVVVFCIFEKCMRCVCCMWHPHILRFVFCSFPTLRLLTQTSPQLSEQVLLLLPRFRSYCSNQRVGVQIP